VLRLADELGEQLEPFPEAAITTDAHSGSGVSKPLLLNWPRYALSQVRRHRPSATVVFLGASDSHPLTSDAGRRIACCGRTWRREYARRTRRMMEVYSRGGEAYVYWLLLPHPRPDAGPGPVNRRRSFVAVNAGVRLAASTMRDTVRVVHLNEVFTPRARYRDTIVWSGRRVAARSRDGIHLSEQGASIAASIVVARMRADGLLMDD
jgi:hypothetical protein